MFYPAQREHLVADIQSYLDSSAISSHANPLGFIVPHAGYVYSGLTAAHAYGCLAGRTYKKVVILAPSHFDAFNGLSVFSGKMLQTPLGQVEVSVSERDRLTGMEGVLSSDLGFLQEHSLEVQLPFLQHVLEPGWQAVPIVMGHQHRDVMDLAARILEQYLDRDSLIIISSDLSHYYPYEKARTFDLKFCDLVKARNLDDLWRAYEQGTVEACGFGPVFAFLSAIGDREDVSIEILDYRNSGDTAGSRSQVVGYCAAGAFWQV